MRKIFVGVGITVMLVLLLAVALAFSATLQDLHINAGSFSESIVAPAAAAAAPMTSAEEGQIAVPSSDQVRFEEFQAPSHICQKDKTTDHVNDF